MPGPNQSAPFGENRQRVLIVIAVIALHLGLLALCLIAARSAHSARSAIAPPLELIYVPTASTLPKHKAAASDLPRLNAAALPITLPSVDLPMLPSSASESQGQAASDGRGAGIDWAAEARRELQAHEIRQNAPPDENHMAGRSPEETWWPRAAHHKGDQYKTDTGDWVVWVNSNCYQVATAMPRSFGRGPAMPQTYCLNE